MKREPIAIVGISCRFPQAKNIAEFWKLLMEEKDTIEEMTDERWNIDQFYDEDIQTPNKTNQRHGSFLKDIYDFDPYFFNISPAEATEMSPSQKLMLELAWEAMEHSNIPVNRLKGKHAGVYIGNIWSDYEHFRKSIHSNVTSHTAIGQSSNAVANRISYALGFTGPSLVVDTGCSSSLVALHLACQSLWDHSLDYAVTGGVNHLLDPDQYVMLTKFGGLSSKGKCSTFDAEADGFVRGEGGGLIILKRLSDAERDHDKIYAVIRSSSMNNNGFNESLPATKTEAQIEMFREAYESCGIKPSDVHYVEAHGTGTRLGDPNECNAIGKYFSTGRSEDRKLHIGSVKTNIGHLEGAAGIAGLIKVVLSMWHKKLPKSLNFKTPNPKIPFEELKLKVQDVCDNWPVREGETFKAGVNSFGWGGTNAHAVIEEYRKEDSCNKCYDRKFDRSVLTLSARSESALRQYAEKYKVLLSENVNGSKSLFEDICVATNVTKPGFEFRFSAHAASKQEMISKLEDFIHDDEMPVVPIHSSEPSKIVFVFPGQGSQWEGMGRELYEKEMVFRDTIDEFDSAFKKYADWSLKDELFAGKETSRMQEINVVQPMLFAMEVGLARLWRSYGIVPDAVVGHSMGEVASAFFAGVLSTDDAARIICTRSLLMKKVSGKGGAMAVTELTLEEATKIADAYQGKVSVAVNNSPKSTVIAGDETTVLNIIDRLDKEGLFCRQINVDVASHSPQMDPLKEELREALTSVTPLKATTELYSTVLDGKVSGEELNADYWVNNLRGMVRFSSVVQQMIRDDHMVFIEVSPHPVLTNAVRECSEEAGKTIISTGSLFRDTSETESIYTNICALFSKGYNISWDKFYDIRKIPFVELPGYPMQRETFKLEDRSGKMAILSGGNANPLIGKKIDLAGIENISVWENVLSLENPVFLNDYKIHETTVFPVSAYLEMLQEAILERFGQGNHVVQDVQYRKAILVPDDETVGIQLRFELINEKKVGFKFFFKSSNGQNGQEWDLSAEGEIHLNVPETAEGIEKVKFDIEKLNAIEDGHDYYESLKDLGLFYGEQFSNIIWMGKMDESVVAEVMPSARIRREQEKFNLHPALLDAAFQVMYADLIWNDNNHSDKTTYYTSIGKYRFVHAMTGSTNLVVKAVVKNVGKTDESNRYMISADVKVFDDQSTLLCEFYDLKSEVIDNNKKATFYTQSPINAKEEKHHKGEKNDKGVYDLIMESKDEKLRLEILHDHLKKSLATVTKAAVSRISPNMTFKGMGVDSLMAVKLRKSIEESLNVRFPVTAFWGHPTINEFALFIRDKINVEKDPKPEDKEVHIPVSENGCPLNMQESQPETFVKSSDLDLEKFDSMTIDELENEIDKELDELL